MSEDDQAGGASTPPVNPPPEATSITVSRGLADWLRRHDTGLAFTTYQTGQLFLVGVLPDGNVSLNQQSFTRAMGVHYQPGRLYLGSQFQVWRLENMLRAGEIANTGFDAVLVPRNAQTIGDVDIHELGVDRDGRVIFVNTKYSCLATLDLTHSFKPIWTPPFISKLAPEDRCHLNGLAMADGVPRYVTAVSCSDVINGWRDRRHEGGVLIEVKSGRVITDQLSMPHSPRVAGDAVWALDSGRGRIVRIDPANGVREDVAFCPGFLRGLALHHGHAIVTLSKPRNGTFSGLALDDDMSRRDADPWCGIQIVDLQTGDIVEWLRFDGAITEMFDVTVLPGIACPVSLGIGTTEILNTISFEPLDPR
jgi:uncharacterized protein (TIGR03032 family)